MTFPRRLLAEQIHMVTRRCSERRFFLKPTEEVKEVVLYALGLALLKCEVEIYALMFEANHYHMVVGDRKSELSEFMKNVDQLVARALNAHYGRGESFWCPGSFSNVEIDDEETLIRKLVYVYSNPVKDGLVARPEEWPGVRTLPEDMGALKLVVKKPKNAFFGGKRPKRWIPRGALTASEIKKREAQNRRDENMARAEGKRPYRSRSKLPEEVTVEIGIPLRVVDGAAFVREVRGALELEIARIHEARRAEGKTRFFGVDAVLATHWNDSAGDTFPAFKLNPRLAPSRDTRERIAQLQGLKTWRAAYAHALLLWRSGKRNTVFPEGTVLMRKLHRCKIGEVTLLAA